jgi:hypothetical protein
MCTQVRHCLRRDNRELPGWVDGFVESAGIRSGYRDLTCAYAQVRVWPCLFQHSFATVDFPVVASIYDMNTQIDKPFYLH